MIKAIDEKYCKADLVQVMYRDGGTAFITSSDEIIFLKRDRKIVINKYENHPNRYEFPYSEDIKCGKFYNCLFEYNKPYITYDVNHIGYSCSLMFFVKDGNRALMYSSSLPIDLRETQDIEEELTREEIEARFNKDNYDAMYIIDVNANSFFINNNLENICLGNGFDFSDEEIIARDLRKRESDQRMANCFLFNGKESTEELKTRPIEEIKNLKLYSGFINKYSYLLLTSKDGEFSLMWFNIVFIEKDRFRLTYSVIPVKLPTIEDVINYANTHNIEYTFEPTEEYGTPEAKYIYDVLNYKTEEPKAEEPKEPQVEMPKKDKSRGLIPKWLRDFRRKK